MFIWIRSGDSEIHQFVFDMKLDLLLAELSAVYKVWYDYVVMFVL